MVVHAPIFITLTLKTIENQNCDHQNNSFQGEERKLDYSQSLAIFPRLDPWIPN